MELKAISDIDMNICIIGKYPPIEGGVSTTTYWLAYGLAKKGHTVHVVTNADEVEEEYRMHMDKASDANWYEPCFKSSKGKVIVHNVSAFSRKSMNHIPLTNPYVSRLAGLAAQVINQYNCKVTLAYYFEPYMVAGWMAACWTSCSLIVKHAGSDLDRLARVTDLAITYKQILRAATIVVTRPQLQARFRGMGVHRHRLFDDVSYSIPTIFEPVGDSLDVAKYAYVQQNDKLITGDSLSFNPEGLPVIGIYGKIGIAKGTYDLIDALKELLNRGVRFRLLAMIGIVQGQTLLPALLNSGIDQFTTILPFLPNWKVPSFIRAVDVTCFLERDFPVDIHGPIIPREVLSCGGCLLLSKEIAQKQQFFSMFVNGENVIIIDDPKNHVDLADKLSNLLKCKDRTKQIGKKGYLISKNIEDSSAYIEGWNQIFTNLLKKENVVHSNDTNEFVVNESLPGLVDILRELYPAKVEAYFSEHLDEPDFEVVIKFCESLLNLISEGNSHRDAVLRELIKYARLRFCSRSESFSGRFEPLYAAQDCLADIKINKESIWNLFPIRASSIQIETFSYDLSDLVGIPFEKTSLKISIEKLDLAYQNKQENIILFGRSANLIPYELSLGRSASRLIELCRGNLNTSGIIKHMLEEYNSDGNEIDPNIEQDIVEAIIRFHNIGVIVLTDSLRQ